MFAYSTAIAIAVCRILADEKVNSFLPTQQPSSK